MQQKLIFTVLILLTIFISMKIKFYLFVFIVIQFTSLTINAQLLSFPTAEGAGKFTTGGRGTVSVAPTIYEVTNLTDVNTAGSFRYACTNGSAARIIVFRVSGTIHLTAALGIKANTTIAGQTAPGDGICIADYPVTLSGNNIIVRYIRFRLGDKNQAASIGNDDAFGDNSSDRSNIVVDHCTMSWSNDEAFTVYHGDKITLQWNFITEPLDKSYHDEGSGVQNHAYGGIESAKQISIHHNLYAHLRGRAPRFDGIRAGVADTADYRNNVIYNWADYNVNGGEGGTYNIVNNYYKYGPSTPSSVTSGINRRNMLINPYKQTSPVIAYGRYYLTGNYCDNSTLVTNNNWLGAAFSGGSLNDSTASKVTAPFNHTPIAIQAAIDSYNDVLAKAGCALPHRDTLDERIVNDVKNRTGKLIDCQGGYPTQSAYALTQNAWPTLSSGTGQIDNDHDGMPDNWETARGLAPSNAADRNTYQTTSGYNNVENYINGDTIVAVGILNTCITTKGVSSTNSGQWLYARDTTFSGYLNTSYTSSTDSNHIVASILDNGNYGTFNVSFYTTNTNRTNTFGAHYGRRNITITPTNPALITQPVTVRFYLSVAEFNALKAADPSINTINDIQILKAEENTCTTILPESFSIIVPVGNAVFGTYSNGYYIEFQTSSFSTFFFQSKLAPIPVKLSSFNVTKQGTTTTAIIDWKTEQEINSKHFLIQRSTNAQSWKTIATIAAAGNSSTPKNYSYSDIDTKTGLFYYRLMQVDIDGKTTQSEIRKINFSSTKTLVQLFPNPAKNMFKIYVADATNFKYTIIDAIGKKVLNKTNNTNSTQIDISSFHRGVYLVQIETNGETINSKLIIQ